MSVTPEQAAGQAPVRAPAVDGMIDWSMAAGVAHRLAPRGPRVGFQEAADTVADLRERSVAAVALVAEVTGLDAAGVRDSSPAEVVDRHGWIDLNIDSFRVAMGPLLAALEEERARGGSGVAGGAVAAAGRVTTAVELGSVLSFLSGRVLGQFEALANDPGRLVLVAPNLLVAEREMQVDAGDFRLWVAVHEVTHRTQFGGAPWLREHLLGGIGELLGAEEISADALRRRLVAGLGEVVGAVRDQRPLPSLLDIAQTPRQREVLDRLTATMSLLEGHAEYVMNAVGSEAIATLPDIRQRFDRRRRATGSASRILRQLLGFEAKMRQYADGSRFAAAVVERAGMPALNRAWQGPESLPTLAELHEPDAWMSRVC